MCSLIIRKKFVNYGLYKENKSKYDTEHKRLLQRRICFHTGNIFLSGVIYFYNEYGNYQDHVFNKTPNMYQSILIDRK